MPRVLGEVLDVAPVTRVAQQVDAARKLHVHVLAARFAADRTPGRSLVEIFRFDRADKIVRRYNSEGLRVARIAEGEGQVDLTCLTVEPGGVIGTHPAVGIQLFLAITGDGWVAGADGDRVPITTGWGVRWEAGEDHTCGTETGLVALAVEGASLELSEPEASER